MTGILRERNYMLDELGDPQAPVGSRLWCLWVANEIRKAIDTDDQVSQALRELTTAFKEHQAWQELGCLSWDDFCDKYLHRPSLRVDATLELKTHGGDRKSDKYQGDNCPLDSMRGNSATHLTARIARDRPDILDGMKAGKFRSVRAASIAANIIDPDKAKRYSLPADPIAAARYLRGRVDPGWLATFVAELSAHD